MGQNYHGNLDRKRGIRTQTMMQITKSLHSLVVFVHPSLDFDLVTLRDLAHYECP